MLPPIPKLPPNKRAKIIAPRRPNSVSTPRYRRACEPRPRRPWIRAGEVYDRSKDALDASVATLERTFDAAGQGAVALNRKIIDIAQRNVNSGFDLAKSLAGAKNLSEMVELQAAYWQKQLNTLTSQAEEVRALATKMAAAASQPLKEQVKQDVDKLGKVN